MGLIMEEYSSFLKVSGHFELAAKLPSLPAAAKKSEVASSPKNSKHGKDQSQYWQKSAH